MIVLWIALTLQAGEPTTKPTSSAKASVLRPRIVTVAPGAVKPSPVVKAPANPPESSSVGAEDAIHWLSLPIDAKNETSPIVKPTTTGQLSPGAESIKSQPGVAGQSATSPAERTLVAPTIDPEHDADLKKAMELYGSQLLKASPLERFRLSEKQQSQAGQLQLSDVIGALDRFFPLLDAATLERMVADGNVVAAMGAFDLNLGAEAISEPAGFYKTNRFGFGFEQPLMNHGARFQSGYRVGRGLFPDWYGERATDEGGEFSAALKYPLLQGRRIDEQRARLFQANNDRQLAETTIGLARIEFYRAATISYWNWLAAGLNLRVANDLVKVAETNFDIVQKQRRIGVTGAITFKDRERVLYSRQAKLQASQQKVVESTQKLALFLRDDNGDVVAPGPERLPAWFPNLKLPIDRDLDGEIAVAYGRRPELTELSLLLRQVGIDLDLAINKQLPKLDAMVKASQDIGEPASKKRDKSDFEFIAGVEMSVPVQRRASIGKQQALRAKRSQLTLKRQFTQDKIAAEVRSALTALIATYQQVDLAKRSLERAREVEDLERRQFFETGRGDIFTVIAREQATADAATALIDAVFAFLVARADYEAATAVNAP